MGQAFMEAGLQPGMWVEMLLSPRWPACHPVDIRSPSVRRVVWAFIVVLKTLWIHSSYPCTCWTPLSRWTNQRSLDKEEELRLLNIVFVRCIEQVLVWQCQRGSMGSDENGKTCASHRLEHIRSMVRQQNMQAFSTDACAWGAADEQTGPPMLKTRFFDANWVCSSICRRCSCPCGRRKKGVHEHIRGTNPGRTETHARFSAHYEPRYVPHSLKQAWHSSSVQLSFRSPAGYDSNH